MNSQAIELKGIVRNQTKIGVQDGQCDDIVNLRFKDGSWRVADNGKLIEGFSSMGYSQLYVHTNIYHHLLGVKNSKLWWFADIATDNETFTALPSPVVICDVQGDVTITQNGHLLTVIIKDNPYPVYAIFKSGKKEYKVLKVNPNGEQTDRELYPYGRVHLNLSYDFNSKREYLVEDTEGKYGSINLDKDNINFNTSGALVPASDNTTEEKTLNAKQLWHSQMLEAFKKAQDGNSFTRPILAIVAVKLYDGSYIYASNPILLNPRERLVRYETAVVNDEGTEATMVRSINYQRKGVKVGNGTETWSKNGQTFTSYKAHVADLCHSSAGKFFTGKVPVYISGASAFKYRNAANTFITPTTSTPMASVVYGSSIVITLGNMDYLVENSDVFKGISIFITREIDMYKMSAEDYKNGVITVEQGDNQGKGYIEGEKEGVTVWGNLMYKPAVRPIEEVVYDLTTSPFYLLREYSISTVKAMSNTSTEIDLSSKEFDGLLANITSQPTLDVGAFDRKNFSPSTAYQYNQKLHFANYKSHQFHGYPIDFFNLNNQNLTVKKGVADGHLLLPDAAVGQDLQYNKSQYAFIDTISIPGDVDAYVSTALKKGTCFAMVAVRIETQQGNQMVVRYIKPYYSNSWQKGDYTPFYLEDFDPLLSFPDARARKMTIKFVSAMQNANQTLVIRYLKTFDLTPHPYLNLSYYIDPNLKPIDAYDFEKYIISLTQFVSGDVSSFLPTEESNNIEDYPNGLKVSMANNPFVFPYESTYQVGSSEIVALMSNAVSVGTGQTGAAPLYVFCKDGIYALLVDSSGEMTYTNARIIARDVCNNAKSVTPIDSGVVFTTDRGLMSIAGSEVVEIGSAAEGDVFDITDTSDKAKKIMFNAFAMQQLAEFPQTLVDNTDFLTYLKGAIVNYNHNERELMVSNPDKDYTYVMDRNGNWSRRAFTAQEYVNNYPTSYRIDKSGKLYKVDADDNETNQVYLLSNVIKLGSIAFKKAYTLVVRGDFNLEKGGNRLIEDVEEVYNTYENTGIIPEVVSIDLYNNKDKTYKLGTYKMDIEYSYEYSNVTQPYSHGVALQIYGTYPFSEEGKDELLYEESLETETGTFSPQITLSKPYKLRVNISYIAQGRGNTSLTVYPFSISEVKSKDTLGLYAFGSYDGRQWSLLGGNEKSGKFTDIGCKIAHTGIKFIRICMAGKISHASRIDFVEISYDDSNLNTKLR